MIELEIEALEALGLKRVNLITPVNLDDKFTIVYSEKEIIYVVNSKNEIIDKKRAINILRMSSGYHFKNDKEYLYGIEINL